MIRRELWRNCEEETFSKKRLTFLLGSCNILIVRGREQRAISETAARQKEGTKWQRTRASLRFRQSATRWLVSSTPRRLQSWSTWLKCAAASVSASLTTASVSQTSRSANSLRKASKAKPSKPLTLLTRSVWASLKQAPFARRWDGRRFPPPRRLRFTRCSHFKRDAPQGAFLFALKKLATVNFAPAQC